MIGETIGHYRILKKLGSGGMGEVYLVEDTHLGRKLVLKILAEKLTKNESYRRHFLREARALSALSHPNIGVIHDYGEEGQQPYVVVEFVQGETLRQRVSRSPTGLRELLDIAIQIASALGKVHAAGIVHRDIKPENIMIRADGLIKVLDFGVAKFSERSGRIDSLLDAVEAGAVMGTALYMSTEQALGKFTDPRTDIWSLGVMLYEMAAGRPPFSGETNADLLVAIVKSDPPPIARFAPEIPAEFERIVKMALRKDPEERYQTAGDLEYDLIQLRRRLTDKDEISLVSPQQVGQVETQAESLSALTRVSVMFRKGTNRMIAVGFFGFIILFVLIAMGLPNARLPTVVQSSDGDPPRIELGSVEMRRTVYDEVKKLKPGQILFNPAKEMRVGTVETVEVRIANSFTDNLNNGLSGLKGSGHPQIEEIRISPYMGVVLSGTESFFHIELKNREQKIVTEDKYTEWIFDVTPIKPGNPSLYLTAYNVIVTPDGERGYESPALSREIKVTTTMAFATTNFVKGNWKEITGLLIASGVLGWIGSKVRKRKRSEFPPWDHS